MTAAPIEPADPIAPYVHEPRLDQVDGVPIPQLHLLDAPTPDQLTCHERKLLSGAGSITLRGSTDLA